VANWATVERFGDPRGPDWMKNNLRAIKAANGQTWQVHNQAAPAFEGLLADLAAAGYDARSSGGYNYRNIRGSNKLSQHAFGTSIDVNAASNPMLAGQLKTDMPANIAEIAAKHNLEWGGNWKNRPDPMHFEWKGDGTPNPVGGAPKVMPAGTNDAPASPMGPQAFAQNSGAMTMPDLPPMAPVAPQQGLGDLLSALAPKGLGGAGKGQSVGQEAVQPQANQFAEADLGRAMQEMIAPSQGAERLYQPQQPSPQQGMLQQGPYMLPQVGMDPRDAIQQGPYRPGQSGNMRDLLKLL
jgi:hypothetical protein